MKKVLVVAAIAEALTGLALLIVPSLVGRLLLGEDLSGIAGPVARVAGIALIGLSIACWPGSALAGMVTYSVSIILYLACLGLAGTAGILLWPAVALHLVLSILLGRTLSRQTGEAALLLKLIVLATTMSAPGTATSALPSRLWGKADVGQL